MTAPIHFDASDHFERMKLYYKRIEVLCQRVIKEQALWLENAGKATCPILEGTLQGDIMMNPQIKRRKFRGWEAEVHAGTGESRDYAVKKHEDLSPGGTDQPGERTQNRPPQPWGPAGGKYLERPLKYKKKDFAKDYADEIKAVK